VRAIRGSGGRWLVENYLPRGVSAVKLYIQLMLWTGRRDRCRREETLTVTNRDKTQEWRVAMRRTGETRNVQWAW